MINSETKSKLFAELEKTGNVALSCARVGIGRATFYHWFNHDATFRKKAKKALKHGRENINDIVENALIAKATKEKDLGSIKYWLSHNDPRYKIDRSSEARIHHSKQMPPPEPERPTFEDYIRDVEKVATSLALDIVEKDEENSETSTPVLGP